MKEVYENIPVESIRNIEEYAKSGVVTISTTWVYIVKPVDIGVSLQKDYM